MGKLGTTEPGKCLCKCPDFLAGFDIDIHPRGAPNMGPVAPSPRSSSALRVCARSGCGNLVKKQTARYCSVRCSSEDPDRRARLSERARSGRLLPMSRQLQLDFDSEEVRIAAIAPGREEVPMGLSRWAV